jgi:hypothetical protein
MTQEIEAWARAGAVTGTLGAVKGSGVVTGDEFMVISGGFANANA